MLQLARAGLALVSRRRNRSAAVNTMRAVAVLRRGCWRECEKGLVRDEL